MPREYITDKDGNVITNSDGEKLFYSKDDGDCRPDTEQTVYRESNNYWKDSHKVDSTYNPTEGKFNK